MNIMYDGAWRQKQTWNLAKRWVTPSDFRAGSGDQPSFAVVNDADDAPLVTNASLMGDHGSVSVRNASVVDRTW